MILKAAGSGRKEQDLRIRLQKRERHVQDSTDDRKQATSLDRFPGGSCGYVRALQCGQRLAGHLAALGLTLGAKIEVLQNPGRGPLLVLVRGTRVALGRGQAAQIAVSEMRDEGPFGPTG
jgi:ferrous iron transport protein A